MNTFILSIVRYFPLSKAKTGVSDEALHFDNVSKHLRASIGQQFSFGNLNKDTISPFGFLVFGIFT